MRQQGAEFDFDQFALMLLFGCRMAAFATAIAPVHEAQVPGPARAN